MGGLVIRFPAFLPVLVILLSAVPIFRGAFSVCDWPSGPEPPSHPCDTSRSSGLAPSGGVPSPGRPIDDAFAHHLTKMPVFEVTGLNLAYAIEKVTSENNIDGLFLSKYVISGQKDNLSTAFLFLPDHLDQNSWLPVDPCLIVPAELLVVSKVPYHMTCALCGLQ